MLDYIKQYINELYSKWVLLVILLFWVIGDITTTYIALENGAVEMNTAARYIIQTYGYISITIYKLILTLILLIIPVLISITYDEYIRADIDKRYIHSFFRYLPKILIYIIAITGIFLTINNTYTIYNLIYGN